MEHIREGDVVGEAGLPQGQAETVDLLDRGADLVEFLLLHGQDFFPFFPAAAFFFAGGFFLFGFILPAASFTASTIWT